MTAHAFRSSLWYRQRFGDGETDVLFNNSGNGTLHVPGLGLPVNLELKATERFAHGASDWAQQRLTAREMAMLRLVNRITDLPGWQGDVLACDDNETLAVLRQQALEEPLISPAAWEWCIAELRDKSAVLEQTGFVSVFDSASCIVKSDDQIPKHVLDRFRLDMSSLRTIALSTEAPNELLEFPSIWGSHTMDLVDPSLYPLTFGKTAVLFKGGCPTRVNPFSMIGQGQTASKPEPMPSREPLSPNQIRTRLTEDGDIWPRWSQGMPYRFSHTIQWMPCEVAFTDEQDAPSVKITSYINNLHPVSYKTLYAMIEKVISLSIKPWDEVLARSGRPRKPPRIRWYGVPWIPVYPAWAYGLQAIAKDPRSEEYQEAKQKVEEYLTIPNPRTGQPGLLGYEKYDMDKRDIMQLAMQRKHMLLKTGWTHPEPGEAFGYSEWKVGKGATAVVAKLHVTDANKNRRPLLREADHEFYTVSLQDTFRKQGLQVIVKLNSIELNPKSPALYVSPNPRRLNFSQLRQLTLPIWR